MEIDNQKPPKRLNQIRLELRAQHYSFRTDRVRRNNVLAGASALGDASPPVAKRHTKRGRLGEMAEFAVLLLPCGGPLCGMRSPNSLGRLGDLSSLALYRPLTRDK
jgi:hypothetical protein